jgi:hypothetical protein
MSDAMQQLLLQCSKHLNLLVGVHVLSTSPGQWENQVTSIDQCLSFCHTCYGAQGSCHLTPPMPLYIGPMVHHLYCCNSNISGSCRRYAATSFTAQPTHILCKRLGKLATACQQYNASCLIDAQASFSCCKAFKQPCSDCLYIGMTNSLLYAFSTNAVACHCD